MARIIFIFLNIVVCFLTIVSKTAFGEQQASKNKPLKSLFLTHKDTIMPIFFEDFESGNLSDWKQAQDWEVSSSEKISGIFSLKHSTSVSGGLSAIFHDAGADLNLFDIDWTFTLKNGKWDPSSSNRFWFYLSADTIHPDLISGWAVGVNIYGSNDLLQLWRISHGKADSLIIQTDLDWNASDLVRIETKRNTQGLWTLSYQRSGETEKKTFSGSDSHLFSFKNIGICFNYTSTRAGQLWVDDIQVSKMEAGLRIQKVTLINSNTLSVEFSKSFLETSVQTSDFRLADEFEQEIQILKVDAETDRRLLIQFGKVQGTELSLQVSGVSDLFGQLISPEVRTFPYSFSPEPGSVLINEILFNPFSGGVDFVELVNVSENNIPVTRLKLASRNDTLALKQVYSVSAEKKYMHPGEYLVCTKDSEVLASQYITLNPETFCVMKSMPSFPDDAGTVVLLNDTLGVLDDFNYSAKMHSPFLADENGVSLERISIEQPASDRNNWASAAASVGFATPGLPNSQSIAVMGIQDEITVEPKAISPNGDGYNDRLSILYRFGKPGYFANVRIFDMAGRQVNYLIKNESLGQEGAWQWKGENDNGQRLNLGVYVILVEVFDRDGNTKAFKKTCTITDRLD